LKPPSTGRILAGVGTVTALVYLAGLAVGIPELCLAVKPFPILALSTWVTVRSREPLGRLVAVGLLLSSLGDVLLETGRFLPGLAAFLAAHLAYIAGFVAADRRSVPARALPFLAWGMAALAVIGPGLGRLAGPVAVYVAVVCAMMWRAAARVGGSGPAAAWLGLAGAVAFGASDTLIALDRFAAPLPGLRGLIMVLYWLGQWGIAASAACSRSPVRRP
jgi:uncharacterized membrane protein YhhN